MLIEILFSLLTLIILEAILGIDNLVFISILSARLPQEEQKKARQLGLMFAWITRILLLLSVIWIVHLNQPLVHIKQFAFSVRDLFMLFGGVFLLVKATLEIHTEFETAGKPQHLRQYANYLAVIFQIALFDIIFSLDSILAAVGLTQQFWIMATAITIAIIIMLVASELLNAFIHRHPTVKMLALSFLLLIGVMLIADGFHLHIPRAYIYFAVCFSLLVEGLNILLTKKKSVRRIS